MEEDSERSRTSKENPSAAQYEELKHLSVQNLNPGPTYEQLNPSTDVDATERSIYDNIGSS